MKLEAAHGQRLAPYVEAPPEPPVRPPNDDEFVEVRLDRLIAGKARLLWQRRRLLAEWVLVGIIVGVALAFLIPKRFDSTVRLMPPDSQTGAMAISAFANKSDLGALASLMGGKSPGQLFVAVLQSDRVCNAIVDRFHLMEVYGSGTHMDARKALRDRTDIVEDRKSGIIGITVSDRQPQRAHDMAEAYVQELSRAVNTLNTSSAKAERIFLDERLKAVKKELDDASKQLSEFATRTGALNVPEQAKAAFTASARLQGELVADEAELQGLEQIYTGQNVRVRQLQARIGELRRQVELSDAGNASQNGSLSSTLRGLPKLGLTYVELFRRYTINEAVYEALTKQYEFAKVEEAKQIPVVNELDPADFPERKAAPRRSLVLLVTMIVFFLFGTVWIVGKDLWDGIDPQSEAKLYVQGSATAWSRRLGLQRLHARSVEWRQGRGPNAG